jgi:soluble lytic murein transglycosylase-like protein
MSVLVKLIALMLLCAASSAWSQSDHAADTRAVDTDDPPLVRIMLERAQEYERLQDQRQGAWQAAILYCEASRLGSAEAQYRLGMQYAFGKGVAESRALAASLFSVASGQGHFEAQRMLDTIEMTSTNLPPCVLEAVLPEPGPLLIASTDPNKVTNIERLVEALPQKKRWVVELVYTLADWYGIDPRLVLSVITAESNFQVRAVSSKSAMGLMQLIPETAERFNVRDAYDATQNIRGGIKYLRWLLSYYRGDVTLAVAAYNAGEKAVDRHKGVPPYAETRQYVKRVLELYEITSHPYEDHIAAPSPLARKG